MHEIFYISLSKLKSLIFRISTNRSTNQLGPLALIFIFSCRSCADGLPILTTGGERILENYFDRNKKKMKAFQLSSSASIHNAKTIKFRPYIKKTFNWQKFSRTIVYQQIQLSGHLIGNIGRLLIHI